MYVLALWMTRITLNYLSSSPRRLRRPILTGELVYIGIRFQRVFSVFAHLTDNSIRPDFLEALLPFIDPKLTHFNKRCISVNDASSGRQLLRFSDGTTFEADLVIGADGIKSAVRKAVIGDDADRSVLHFPNIYGYRALVPIDNLRSSEFKINILTHPFIWVGQGKVSPMI